MCFLFSRSTINRAHTHQGSDASTSLGYAEVAAELRHADDPRIRRACRVNRAAGERGTTFSRGLNARRAKKETMAVQVNIMSVVK